MNDTKISLTLNLVNATLNYLGTRPYGEVYQLVQEIQAQAIPQVPTPSLSEETQASE
jgi:hypothetical protein